MPRVMIVDDDPDIRASFTYLLQGEGYEVMTAVNGREALDLLLTRPPPCVIFLDMLMPVMDGIEFLEEFRTHGQLKSVPVVVVSAASTAKPPPGIPILKKPVSIEDLLHVVEKYSTLPGC